MGEISFTWPREINEHGRPMLWFGSWLVGEGGEEGEWFYNGRGGEATIVAVPTNATGVRIRRWPNEGFDPEYADLLDIGGRDAIRAGVDVDFDVRQRHSRLTSETA